MGYCTLRIAAQCALYREFLVVQFSIWQLFCAHLARHVSPAALEGWRLHLACTYFMMRDLSAEEQELVPGMIQAWQTAALAAYKADGGTDDWFAVTNFEAQRHWADQMKWLGPPPYVVSHFLSFDGGVSSICLPSSL